MLVLETRNGHFLLENATRIDFYRKEEKKISTVSMSIDSYKFPLQSFESKIDAITFCHTVRHLVLESIERAKDDDFQMPSLDCMCDKAMKIVENGEDDTNE